MRDERTLQRDTLCASLNDLHQDSAVALKQMLCSVMLSWNIRVKIGNSKGYSISFHQEYH